MKLDRFLAAAVTVLAGALAATATAAPAPAAAQGPAPAPSASQPPLCQAKALAVHELASVSAGTLRRTTVAFGFAPAPAKKHATQTVEPCLVAGYPDVTLAGAVKGRALVTGRIAAVTSATIEAGSTATLLVQAVVASAEDRGSCALAFAVGGAPVLGSATVGAPCGALRELDLTSFEPAIDVNVKPPAASPPASVAICPVAALQVRDAGGAAHGALTSEEIAVQNVGVTTCAVAVNATAQLIGGTGIALDTPLRPRPPASGVAATIPLEPGHEASLTLAFPTTGKRCVRSDAVALALPGGTFTGSTPTAFAPCLGGSASLQETLLRPGVPLPL